MRECLDVDVVVVVVVWNWWLCLYKENQVPEVRSCLLYYSFLRVNSPPLFVTEKLLHVTKICCSSNCKDCGRVEILGCILNKERSC